MNIMSPKQASENSNLSRCKFESYRLVEIHRIGDEIFLDVSDYANRGRKFYPTITANCFGEPFDLVGIPTAIDITRKFKIIALASRTYLLEQNGLYGWVDVDGISGFNKE